MIPGGPVGISGVPYSQTALCQSFIALANRTSLWMTYARQPNLVPGETAITDFNLFNLWLQYPNQVRIWRHSARREARSGADWEWWLGGNGAWLGLRVQAKKLDNVGPAIPKLEASRAWSSADGHPDRAG